MSFLDGESTETPQINIDGLGEYTTEELLTELLAREHEK